MNHTSLDFTKLKVGEYARKSSEGEDKQMLSIPSQIGEAKRIAEYYKLPSSVRAFQEAKSAKKEFARPEFTELIRMIKCGLIDSILCWKLDRLARNMTEGGMLIDLLSSGVIKAIITHDKVYYPSDNVLLMSVEFSQGTQFLKDLSVNVKRGQTQKASMGIPHGVATLGFLNDKTEEKGNRKWRVDQPKLDAIKILLDMFLTGTYSAGKLHRYAVEDLKLTTVQRKRIGGAPIVLSRIYEILTDPIYAGFFFYGGKRYDLHASLPRLITEDQHIKIKIILAKKHLPKIQEYQTVYSGFLHSDEGDFIGQDVHPKLICDCKKIFAYQNKTHCLFCGAEIASLNNPRYFVCTSHYNVRKKKAKQDYKSISEDAITKRLATFIDEHLTFSDSLASWSHEYIVELERKEINDRIFKKQLAEQNKTDFEKKKTRLREMLRDDQITEAEYKTDLEALEKRYGGVDDKNSQEVDWVARMHEIVDLTTQMQKLLAHGTVQQKRLMLSKLGSNLIWDDKELNIHNDKAIERLVDGIRYSKEISPEFEPKYYVVDKGSNEKTEPKDPVFSTMLRG